MASNSRLKIRYFNNNVRIRDLLKELGAVRGEETSIYCPFHEDTQGGHKSAAVRDNMNLLKCYSEQKVYRPYDVLKLLGKSMDDYLDPDTSEKIAIKEGSTQIIPETIVEAVRKRNMSLNEAALALRNYLDAM